MSRAICLALASILLLPLATSHTVRTQGTSGWPEVSSETKPWTRWWWLGSALDVETITRELEALRDAGFGGVEITPIYGVRGHESRFVPYLSDAWLTLLDHTLREARRLGLGVDMATGTGWPFGGPWVSEADAAHNLLFRRWQVAGGGQLAEEVRLQQQPLVRALGAVPLPRSGVRPVQITDVVDPIEKNRDLQALALEQVRYPKEVPLLAVVARSVAGAVIDLTSRVTAARRLEWTAPPGDWTVDAVFLGSHGKLVERAAPGGEGNVIDHFSREAIRRYLARFDRAFSARRPAGLRAFFNDSYEVDDATGQADATPSIFDAFLQRRGYDLREHLPALLDEGPADTRARVLADYRLTLSDLLLDTFTTEWDTWARRHRAMTRNQAHGSPANLLDLYGASDIPETEGLEIARSKWAASAGHVAGRRLIAAEAATWLGEHFRTTLADVRAHVDGYFVAGVNHLVYHGTAASPADAAWPGWLFYAAVEFNDRNPWWRDLPALNRYVTRVQSFLQSGVPDHDALLYYPFYDFIATPGKARLAHFGGANAPDEKTAFEAARDLMQGRGYTYDFVSDRQLGEVRVAGSAVVTGGGTRYSVIAIPASRYIPPDTFSQIVELANQGATVLAIGGFAADVTGMADLPDRRERHRRAIAAIPFGAADAGGIAEARVGRGRILRGDHLEPLLARAQIAREPMVDRGLAFARRRSGTGRVYFISNPGTAGFTGWVPLAGPAGHVNVCDPMYGDIRSAPTRSTGTAGDEVHLNLPAGESLILVTNAPPAREAAAPTAVAGASIPIDGPWELRFISGGPALPAARTIARLASWTTLGADDLQPFSGTATYSTRFPRSANRADLWSLDLGRVHESAQVRLNGRDLGTLIGPRFTLTVTPDQLRASNVLEVTVTNLMANRIAALDRAGVGWRKFYNVNFPSRFPENRGTDGLFTAAKWEPLPSGLLGPVVLTPLRTAPP